MHSGLNPAKVICYVYTYKYGTNRTSECYSIPALYYTEQISLISKHFISKCQVLNSFGRHFCWDKNGRRSVYNWTFLVEIF